MNLQSTILTENFLKNRKINIISNDLYDYEKYYIGKLLNIVILS